VMDAMVIVSSLALLSGATALRMPTPPHQPHVAGGTSMAPAVTVTMTEAFSPESNVFMMRNVLVTAPVATDAFSLAMPKKQSATYDISLKDQMRESFEGMSPDELESREKAADEIFQRVAATLATGLEVRYNVMITKKDREDEARARDYDDDVLLKQDLLLNYKRPGRIRFA